MNLTTLKRALSHGKGQASFARRSITLCAFSLAAFDVSAQKGFDFGLKGGMHASSLLNSTDQAAGPELDFTIKSSFAVGAGIGYNFSERMGVEVDVLSARQGQSYKGDPTKITAGANVFCNYIAAIAVADGISMTGTSYTADVIMQTLKIPILFRLSGVNTRKSYFSCLIGPQIDMLSSTKLKINGQDAATSTDLYKKSTIDAVLGVGAGFNVSDNFLITAHVRMDYGLGDVEDKPSGSSGRAATHNATAGLLVGISYKLVKKAVAGDKKGPAKKK